MTVSWSTSSSQLGRGSRPDDFATSIRTEAWTVVVPLADDDRVIAAAKKGAPTSWCAQYSLKKLASFSLKNYGSGESASARFGTDAENAVNYDAYVTQDDEVFEYSDVRLAADWEAFLSTLLTRDSVRSSKRGAQQHADNT